MRTWLWITALWLSGIGISMAEESSLPEELQIHGFLAQGYVKTSDNNFFGESKDGSWDFREIGLNASYQPLPNLLFSGQLLSRTAGDMDDGDVRVDYALVDYSFFMDADARMGVRVGRLKNPLGFYNDTRDVPFTRPSIFLPQSIYFDRVRNLELSSDGAGLYGNWLTDFGDITAQFYMGTLPVDENVEYTFMSGNLPGKLEIDDPWAVWRLMYETSDGRLRFAVSRANGKMQYKPAAVDILSKGTIDLDFWVLSAQYNTEKWSLTGEFLWEPIEYDGFNVDLFNTDLDVMGWYVQGAYRINPEWEVFVRYDNSDVERKFPFSPVPDAVLNAQPDHDFFAKDFTIGVRWDVTSQFMLRAEYHRVDGTVWLSRLENDGPTRERRWDMFALQASYRF